MNVRPNSDEEEAAFRAAISALDRAQLEDMVATLARYQGSLIYIHQTIWQSLKQIGNLLAGRNSQGAKTVVDSLLRIDLPMMENPIRAFLAARGLIGGSDEDRK